MLKTWWKKTTQNHMLRVQHGPPRLTLLEWKEILEQYDHKCAYCGDPAKPGEWLELEHLTPLSKGGEHRRHNVVPACGPCNKDKGSMTLAEYKEKIANG